MHKKETIVVFSAHSDDYVIGAGGTICSYVQQGKKVIAIIMSYGEKSHPWLKGKVVQKFRSKEAFEASRLLGCKTIFFDLQELKFKEDYQHKGIEQELLALLEKEQPMKIFTHSDEDPHPDHFALHTITLNLCSRLSYQPELYIYSIWNPISLQTRLPTLYVDTTSHIKTLFKALRSFKSQQIHISFPLLLLTLRTLRNGFKIGTLFAEKFYRIR